MNEVNHVMGNNVHSLIFSHILDNFHRYGRFDHKVSPQPLKPNNMIYLHHRINKSESIPENSVAFVHHDLEDFDVSLSTDQFLSRYSKCSGIICLNTNQKAFIENELGINNSIVIPHGYSYSHKDVFETVLKQRKSKGYFRMGAYKKISLMVSSRRYLRGVKGEGTLYQLAKDLDPEIFEFVFIGKDRHLDQIFFQKCGFDCYSINPISYKDTLGIYASVDILLNLSWHEGGPANLPEAIKLSVPTLSRNIGMATDLLSSHFYFTSYKVLLDKLNRWSLDSVFREETMNNIFESNKKIFSSLDVTLKVEEFLYGCSKWQK
jgi:hypothetical protein